MIKRRPKKWVHLHQQGNLSTNSLPWPDLTSVIKPTSVARFYVCQQAHFRGQILRLSASPHPWPDFTSVIKPTSVARFYVCQQAHIRGQILRLSASPHPWPDYTPAIANQHQPRNGTHSPLPTSNPWVRDASHEAGDVRAFLTGRDRTRQKKHRPLEFLQPPKALRGSQRPVSTSSPSSGTPHQSTLSPKKQHRSSPTMCSRKQDSPAPT